MFRPRLVIRLLCESIVEQPEKWEVSCGTLKGKDSQIACVAPAWVHVSGLTLHLSWSERRLVRAAIQRYTEEALAKALREGL